MSNNYGLVVNNSNGGIMFDSRRGMNSYVVKEVGTGTYVNLNSNDDFIFIKRPSGESHSFYSNNIFLSSRHDLVNGNAGLIPTGAGNNPIRNFFKYNQSTGTFSTATLDYFVVTHSSNIDTTSEDYGLLINNSNGSVQFDSRSVTNDDHFLITDAKRPGSISGDGTVGLGDMSDYWSTNWTGSDIPAMPGGFVEQRAITGIKWLNTSGKGPTPINFIQVTITDPITGNTSFTTDYYNINKMIISAELV